MARQDLFFCNGVRINSVTDLYDNFNFQDIINALSSGKLQQWLTANGFHAECEAISQMDLSVEDADVQILKVLKCPEEKQIAYQQRKREIAERKAREKAEAERKVQEAEIVPAEAPKENIGIAVNEITEPPRNELSPTEIISFVKLKRVISKEVDMPESMIKLTSTFAETFELSEFDKKRLFKTIGREFDVSFKDKEISELETVRNSLKLLALKIMENDDIGDC